MKELKKNLALVVSAVLVAVTYVLFAFAPEILGQNPIISTGIVGIFIGAVNLVYYRTIVYPLYELNREIALFITGKRKGEKLQISAAHPYVQFIMNFFNKVLDSLKNIKNEFLTGKTLRGEIEIAAEIQKLSLSRTHIVTPDLVMVANSKSASEVGGDSYDVIEGKENTFMYIGDVTGHGVASGFVMMIVNSLIASLTKLLYHGNEIVGLTNEIMKPRVRANMMMTLLFLRWNIADKQLFMTGAGHENLLVWKKATGEVITVKSGGMALGMLRDIRMTLKETQIPFEPGDIAIMYTDGITEARNSAGTPFTLFGLKGLIDAIKTSPYPTAQGVFNNITVNLSRFMGYHHKQFDDITLIVIEFRGNKPAPEEPKEIPTDFITEWKWN